VSSHRSLDYAMKFSCSKDFSLGIVDVLNYKRTIEKWDFKDLFPLALGIAGKGSFYHPFHLVFSDPLIEGIEICFHEILGRGIYGSEEDQDADLDNSISNPQIFLIF
jgi:hypothetical protein